MSKLVYGRPWHSFLVYDSCSRNSDWNEAPGMLRESNFLAGPGFGIVVGKLKMNVWNGPKLATNVRAWTDATCLLIVFGLGAYSHEGALPLRPFKLSVHGAPFSVP
eukprot:751810-Pelagomonas_calceolata.AAC.1